MGSIGQINSHYAVIIVGAGPAGANLARLLEESGRSVLLVDGSKQRGGKVCAGLLSPDAQAILARYDVNLPNGILASPQLFSVRTLDLDDASVPMRRYLRSYVNMDRAGFDRFLREMVPKTVTAIEAVCTAVRRETEGFSVTLLGGGDTVTVTSDLVCGADGSASVVRRSLFPEKKIKRYAALQEWFPADARDSYYSCIFDNATSESCSWIFFKDGNLVFGGAFDPKNARKAFEKQKEKLVRRGIVPASVLERPIKTEACAVSRPQLLRGIFLGGGGAFLLGEAAGLISPSSLEGISYALSSAEILAEAITHGTNGRAILRFYHRGTRALRLKLRLKCLKRPFMYRKLLRTWILRLGIGALRERPDTVRRFAEAQVRGSAKK